jgi:hypothetical protein
MDFWVKLAQITQGFLTPVIALLLGIITYQLQRQQTESQRQAAETNRLQYRFGLMDRRMKVFNATLEFIALVVKKARVESLDPLATLMWETKERPMLFGAEIGEYIDELYSKGVALNTIYVQSSVEHVMRPEDVAPHTEIMQWFTGQSAVATEKFLRYMDCRKP